MSVSKKSNIRSRWYRANEKPLESKGSESKTNEPVGEISISDKEKFKDDLILVKPISPKGDAHSGKQQSNEGKNRRKKYRPKNDTSNHTKGREARHSKNFHFLTIFLIMNQLPKIFEMNLPSFDCFDLISGSAFRFLELLFL